MTLQRQIGFWLACLAGFIVFLYLFSGVLMPFVAAIILAYLLDPIVDRFVKLGLSRLVATLLIMLLVTLAFVLVLLAAVPLLVNQLTAFINNVPGYVSRLQVLIAEQGGPLIERFGGPERLKEVQAALQGGMGDAAKWAGGVLTSIISGGSTVVGLLSLLVLTPVIAFYVLLDWDTMVKKVDGWLPLPQAPVIRDLARQMDQTVAGFLRGQALLCLILGLFYAVGLSLIGLHFGFLIGIVAGIISFVPFVGSITGLLIGGGVAIAQFWPEYWWILAVIGVFGLGQFIEGNILQPKLLGDAVGLHPVWLMFSLLAFGSLFGFVGVLLAVPVAAAIGVLVRFALSQYLTSRLYTGSKPRDLDS
ncbi:MAG: AI-2E family transporter [Methylobacterium sp.]|jgi:predicted PurR-regulated permease PerM|nr:AI-2E family transporter [Methylobacterium sp.]MCA3635918.1 AI-2E family transporter [Methylobacterium sp.]MCA3637977.1 AI-2E family transporter [Methylobacterium sp.]MCE2933227.1 AI-2E family transporter [Hyphomicrobiales bacterium]